MRPSHTNLSSRKILNLKIAKKRGERDRGVLAARDHVPAWGPRWCTGRTRGPRGGARGGLRGGVRLAGRGFQ